jgi:hypothetical protein
VKIITVEVLHYDARWRVDSLLTITTEDRIVGLAEHMEGCGAQGFGRCHSQTC